MEQIAEIAGTLIGIAYLYWEYKADDKVWLAGMLMPAISLVVYWQSGLYADFGINVYYLLVAVYGLYLWRGNPQGGPAEALPITHTPLARCPLLLLAFLVSFLLIGWMLCRTDSTVPWWDAFTTALSIVGMWMLARKWLEQWWVSELRIHKIPRRTDYRIQHHAAQEEPGCMGSHEREMQYDHVC